VDIADVKKKLSSDEKVLVSAFKLETLYKKHKFKIWAVVAALLLFFIGKTAMDAMHNAKLAEANQAFLTLQIKAKQMIRRPFKRLKKKIRHFLNFFLTHKQ